jgi:hypothetical protein
MLGFSQVTRPRTSAAASAPGNRDADGYDRTVTRLRRRGLQIPPIRAPRAERRDRISGSPRLISPSASREAR